MCLPPWSFRWPAQLCQATLCVPLRHCLCATSGMHAAGRSLLAYSDLFFKNAFSPWKGSKPAVSKLWLMGRIQRPLFPAAGSEDVLTVPPAAAIVPKGCYGQPLLGPVAQQAEHLVFWAGDTWGCSHGGHFVPQWNSKRRLRQGDLWLLQCSLVWRLLVQAILMGT